MIPTKEEIRRGLLMELYACDDHAAIPEDIYVQLLEYVFKNQPDRTEIEEPYHNSKNQ